MLSAPTERQDRGSDAAVVEAEPVPPGPATAFQLAPHSPQLLLRLLSVRNMELMRLIKVRKPRSVAELARLSGRPKASLMVTLRRLQSAGLLAIRDIDGRRKVPEVVCDRVTFDIRILPEGTP